MTPEFKQNLLNWAEIIDAHRVVPKIIMAGYGYIVWDITVWFKDLGTSATSEQQWLVSAVWGSAALITTFYFQSGRKWTLN